MKTSLIPLAAVCLPLATFAQTDAGSATAADSATPASDQQTVSPAPAYGFPLPADWQVGPPMAGVDYIAFTPLESEDDLFRENVNVVVEPAAAQVDSAAELLELSLPSLQAVMTDFEEVSRESIELGGEPAVRLHYRASLGEMALDNDVVLVIHNDIGYVVTASMLQGESRERWEEPMREVVDGLEFGDWNVDFGE